MRVLLTTDTIGGVWTYTKELTEGLLQRSHSIALVSFGRSPSADQSAWCSAICAKYPEHFHYTASETPLEWMDANGSAYAGAENLLLHTAQSFGADLVHSNQFCFGRLPVSIPKLVVAHSDVLSWAAACRPCGLEPSPWLNTYKRQVQEGLSSADAVVAPTHWMLQALADHFSLPGEAYVIANGRDLSLGSTRGPRKLQAVTVGRLWDEAKGLALLGAVSSPTPIFVAGELDHQRSTAPQSVGDATLLGQLHEALLMDLFGSSSIYLALSVYEPFGLAPLEAALCGCAVIARDIASLREVWGDAALYFQDARSLSSLLGRLTGDPELLGEFRRLALNCARKMSRSRMTELYLRLYRHLLAPDSPFLPVHALAEVPQRAS